MSKDAQPALAMPDRLVPMADLDQAQADPAAGAGTPQALELRHLRYFVALAEASTTHGSRPCGQSTRASSSPTRHSGIRWP
jgi:hypothetical protein